MHIYIKLCFYDFIYHIICNIIFYEKYMQVLKYLINLNNP